MASKIINGVDAVEGRYPYMASLLFNFSDFYYGGGGYYNYSYYGNNYYNRKLQGYYYYESDYDYEAYAGANPRHGCGGTLITSNVVLTAAHCVVDSEAPGRIEAAFGCVDITDESDCIVVPSKEVVINPDFDSINFRAGDDLALIFLEEDVDFPVVKLAGEGIVPTNGEKVRNVGWGITFSTDPRQAEILQEIDVEIVDNEVCIPQIELHFGVNEYYGDNLLQGNNLDTIICTIGDATSACNGDSGGPLMYACDTQEEVDIQIGVVSFGFTCGGDGVPIGFEQVNSADGLQFIRSELALRNQTIEFATTLDGFCPGKPLEKNPSPTPFPTFDPDAWICDPFLFGDRRTCNCGCGIPDVDCEIRNTPNETEGCGNNEICVNDVCVEFVGTNAPTNVPTESPTVSGVEKNAPTNVPTESPINAGVGTIAPTNVPTKSPSFSEVGTIAPTNIPTESPTNAGVGTNAPTESPTTAGEEELFGFDEVVLIGIALLVLILVVLLLLLVISCLRKRQRERNALEPPSDEINAKDLVL